MIEKERLIDEIKRYEECRNLITESKTRGVRHFTDDGTDYIDILQVRQHNINYLLGEAFGQAVAGILTDFLGKNIGPATAKDIIGKINSVTGEGFSGYITLDIHNNGQRQLAIIEKSSGQQYHFVLRFDSKKRLLSFDDSYSSAKRIGYIAEPEKYINEKRNELNSLRAAEKELRKAIGEYNETALEMFFPPSTIIPPYKSF